MGSIASAPNNLTVQLWWTLSSVPLCLLPSFLLLFAKPAKAEHGKQSRERSEKELWVAFAVVAKLQLGVEINSIAVYIWFFCIYVTRGGCTNKPTKPKRRERKEQWGESVYSCVQRARNLCCVLATCESTYASVWVCVCVREWVCVCCKFKLSTNV